MTSDAAARAGGCSGATARRLVNANHLNDFLLTQPVAQQLCGPFTGPGSRAMVVTIRAATCWAVQQWAVFRFAGGSWHLVKDRHVWVVPPVVRVGGNFRVTSPVARPTDAYCDPTGGTLARTWHWNGARFVLAGSRRTSPAPQTAEFYDRSLSRVIGCDMTDSPASGLAQVICTSYASGTAVEATLTAAGRVTVCAQSTSGSANRCNLGNLGAPIPTFAVGHRVTIGRFRCDVLTAGVQCIVRASGQGFQFGSSTVAAVGGAPLSQTS